MAKSRIGNRELISDVNQRLILQAVRVMQPTFRAEVARKTGLKPASVTAIVNHLIEEGMLREVPGVADNSSRFGRPPLMLEVNGDARRILAIDLEPDHIRVASTDLLARLIDYRDYSIDRMSAAEPILDRILQVARELVRESSRKRILGVGISLPGVIDPRQGVLISSTNMPRWRDVPVAATIRAALRLPVRVERSVQLAALYEAWSNPGQHDRTMAILSLRTGIGLAIIHHGQLYRGANGLGGEIGHCIVDIDGPTCECGGRGCLETFVSAPAIVKRGQALIQTPPGQALAARVRSGRALTPELIYELAAEGDEGCGGIVRDVGRYLGIAVSNVINLLAPNEVVLCGAIDTAERLILESVRVQIAVSALPHLRDHVTIRTAKEREKLPVLGAAVLIAQDIFVLPELRHADTSSSSANASVEPVHESQSHVDVLSTSIHGG